MNRYLLKLIVLSSALLFSASSIAFQEDFRTVDSTPPPRDLDNYDIKYIMNPPYSYCAPDGIPEEFCGNISLRLNDTQFQNINPEPNFNALYNYGTDGSVNQTNMNAIVSNFRMETLPIHIPKTWKIPTPGQLMWMINQGMIPKLNKGDKYWVRRGGEIRTATVGLGYGNDSVARLYRLVTDDAPSDCDEGGCDLFQDNRGYTVHFRRNMSSCHAAVNWGWGVIYKLPGQAEHVYGKRGVGNYWIPSGVEYAHVRVWNGSTGWRERYNIQNTDRDAYSADECYQLVGTCGWTDIENSGCWF